MNAALAWSRIDPPHKSLLIALALAVLAHLLVISIHFQRATRTPPMPSLPVIQIDLQAQPPSPPPKHADAVAERDQRAPEPSRGAAPQIKQDSRAVSAPPAELSPPTLAQPAQPSPPTPPVARAAQKPVEAQGARKDAPAPKPPTPKPTPATPSAAPDTPPSAPSLAERGLQMARLKADVLQQSLRDDVAARSATLTSNTRYGAEAAYLNAWVEKVETIGNQNYPIEARQKNIEGRLMLKVTLDAWGKVLDVRVQQTSGQPLLDQAAINIVHLGAPYAKFPLDMREKYDQITILRTWVFGSKGLDTR